MITVEGRKVGYMYREQPDTDVDSGWRFNSGLESQMYMDDPSNHSIYDVNTIANYDAEIIPFLGAQVGAEFERERGYGKFVQIGGQPWEPGSKPASPWPPPGYPLVEGDHALTETWSVRLPERFARRVEAGALVLWRPGLTIWLTAWNNDHDRSRSRRLAWIKESASQERFSEREDKERDVTRYSYRLRDESDDGPVESLYGFVVGDSGHLQMAIYFDDPAAEAVACQLVQAVAERMDGGPT
jgi:hypothetical protein